MLERVPATREHFERFRGDLPGRTVKAFAVVDGEDVLALAGYYPDQGRVVVFAGIRPEARARPGYARAVLEHAKAFMGEVTALGLPVHAVPEQGIEGSGRLLAHLGFKPEYKDTWALERQEA